MSRRNRCVPSVFPQTDDQTLATDAADDDQQEQQTIASINDSLTQQENSVDQTDQAAAQAAAQNLNQTLSAGGKQKENKRDASNYP